MARQTNLIYRYLPLWAGIAVVCAGIGLSFCAYQVNRDLEPEPSYPVRVISVGSVWGETLNNHDPVIVACRVQIKDSAGKQFTWAGSQYCSLKQGDMIE